MAPKAVERNASPAPKAKGTPKEAASEPVPAKETKPSCFAYAPQMQTRATAAYCLVNVLNGGITTAFSASILPLARGLNTTPEVLGAAVTASKVGKLVATFAFMGYGERLKNSTSTALLPHITMGSACALLTAVAMALPGAASVTGLSGVLAVVGFVYGFTDSSCSTFVLWIWQDSPAKCTTAVSTAAACYTGGCLLSPLLVGASLSYVGNTAPTFFLWSVVSMIASVALIVTPSPPQPAMEDKGEENESSSNTAAGNVSVLLRVFVAGGLFVMVGAEHAFGTWLSTYAGKQLQMTDAAAAVVTSAYWTALTVGRMINTALSTAQLNNWIMLSGLLLTSLISSLLLQLHTDGSLWLAAAGMGLGVSAIYPIVYTLPASHGVVLSTRQATTIFLVSNAGEAIYPWAAGVLMARFGPTALEWFLTFSIVGMLLAAVYFWARVSAITNAEKKAS